MALENWEFLAKSRTKYLLFTAKYKKRIVIGERGEGIKKSFKGGGGPRL